MTRPDLPPFAPVPGWDALAVAEALVASFDDFSRRPDCLSAAFAAAAAAIDLPGHDPLYRAGAPVAAAMQRGIGVNDESCYHSARHCCEVLLCSVYLARSLPWAPRAPALLVLAALLHDFHHDGGINGDKPFRLEQQALREAAPFLDAAGVSAVERAELEALVLATETSLGTPFARGCYRWQQQPAAVERPPAPLPALERLYAPGMAALALALAEADVLPSVGLTIEHADRLSARLAKEWNRPLDAADKLNFIETIGDFTIARFFSPNLERVRQINRERLAVAR